MSLNEFKTEATDLKTEKNDFANATPDAAKAMAKRATIDKLVKLMEKIELEKKDESVTELRDTLEATKKQIEKYEIAVKSATGAEKEVLRETQRNLLELQRNLEKTLSAAGAATWTNSSVERGISAVPEWFNNTNALTRYTGLALGTIGVFAVINSVRRWWSGTPAATPAAPTTPAASPAAAPASGSGWFGRALAWTAGLGALGGGSYLAWNWWNRDTPSSTPTTAPAGRPEKIDRGAEKQLKPKSKYFIELPADNAEVTLSSGGGDINTAAGGTFKLMGGSDKVTVKVETVDGKKGVSITVGDVPDADKAALSSIRMVTPGSDTTTNFKW